MTLIFIAVSAILAGGILNSATSHRYVAANQMNMERALFVAEAGLEAAGQLVADNQGFMATSVTTLTGTQNGGAYTATIREEPGWKNFSISVLGSMQGVSRRVDIDRAYIPTFANYAMWSVVNGVIYYFPGETFDGLIHSDDKLWFSSSQSQGGPVFSNKVTSGASTYGGNNDYAEFHDGFEMNASAGTMANVDFNFLKARAGLTGHDVLLEGRTTIEFNGNQMLVTNSRQGWTDHPVHISADQLVYISDSASGDTGTRAGKVDIEGGTVDGRVTIASEDDMYIHDHIRYDNDPRNDGINDPADPHDDDFSDDALGLISKDDIWVDTDAPNNLDLQAAVLATGQKPNNDGSFGVLYYYSGSSRGDLKLYGSLVQEKRGYVNTSNGNGIATGYRKTYGFDKRFKNSSPPYYPELSNQIIFVGWNDGPA